ncbi:MAG TPA: hypothetical protein VMW52_11010 [Phycisphaerae bacterium]|nr:hypothetical protein [Phycisphaerae bacterium]
MKTCDQRLRNFVHMAGWPTPQQWDGERGGESPETKKARGAGGVNLGWAAQLAGWPTPMAGSPATDRYNAAGNTDSSRKTVALLAGRATPAERDYRHPNAKPYRDRGGGKKGEQLSSQVVHSGPISTSSPAATEKRGVLSPEHSRWLMGYPAGWLPCGATATPSCPRSQPSS